MNVSQRVGVFVDVSNMYHSARNLYNARVNFAAILRNIVGKRELIRALAYVVSADITEEKSFFEALRLSGYEVKSKDLQVFAGGAKKGDWDVGITVDAIILGQKLDVIVLVTGDGDYVPLVEYLKNNSGCRIEVAAFARSASSRLIEVADQFVDFDADPNTYLLKQRVVNRVVNQETKT